MGRFEITESRMLVFCLVRSRGSVEERPLHTRKVAGSIPAGTTEKRSPMPRAWGFFRSTAGSLVR